MAIKKAGPHIQSMLQHWILEYVKIHHGIEVDLDQVKELTGALVHGFRFTILPDEMKLSLNAVFKTDDGFKGSHYDLNNIIDYKETEDTLWFQDNIGEYLFRKTHHDLESYVVETSSRSKYMA